MTIITTMKNDKTVRDKFIVLITSNRNTTGQNKNESRTRIDKGRTKSYP